jgi:hypothetical protein
LPQRQCRTSSRRRPFDHGRTAGQSSRRGLLQRLTLLSLLHLLQPRGLSQPQLLSSALPLRRVILLGRGLLRGGCSLQPLRFDRGRTPGTILLRLASGHFFQPRPSTWIGTFLQRGRLRLQGGVILQPLREGVSMQPLRTGRSPTTRLTRHSELTF